MCYDSTARPPFPPIEGGAGDVGGRDIVLTASDGARLAAHTATTGEPGGPGIVILPDVRGLHPFYQELAERYAQAGVHATAFDYFGRTAGVGSGEARGDEFDYMHHVQRTDPETIALDVAATAEHVRSPEGGAATAVFTVGFCFGGRQSFNQAARQPDVAGVIGFYGRVAAREPGDRDAPIGRAKDYRCPVLGLFGGADAGIPAGDVEAFREALAEAGVDSEVIVYPGLPHSFFDRQFAQYREECDHAWGRILAFIQAHR